MVIVDTSRLDRLPLGKDTVEVEELESLLSQEKDIFITGIVIQEVLTGIKEKRDRTKVKRELEHFIPIHPTIETHVHAAEVFDA